MGLHVKPRDLPDSKPSEAETFWNTFLRSLVNRGLRGNKLVISAATPEGFRDDTHEGLKAAVRRVMGATWQRRRVHWMSNALAYVPKGQQGMASASLRQAFGQDSPETARQVWRAAADAMRQRRPKSGEPLGSTLHSTNPLERLNKEVKRRADMVGISPSKQSIVRLIGAVLLEQNDEWQLQHRHMQVKGIAGLVPPAIDGEARLFRLPRSHPKPHDPGPTEITPA